MSVIFCCLLLFSVVAHAAPVSDEGDSGIRFILTHDAEKVEKKAEGSPAPQFKVESSAWAGPIFSSYSMASTSGNSIKLPLTMGSGLGGGILLGPASGTDFDFRIQKAIVEYPVIPGVTTAPLEVVNYDANFGVGFSFGEIRVRPGYRIHLRDVRETGPSAVMTSSVQHGPSLMADYLTDVGKGWQALASAGAFAPIFFREKFQSSGDSRLRFGLSLSGGISYRIVDKLRAGIIPKISYFMNTFSGRGARSISNVNEKWISFSIPLEVSYVF